MFEADFNTLCIESERDPRKYSKIKKKLFNVFSTKALVKQKQLIRELIDTFIDRIEKDDGPVTKGPNITKWYEMIAFDVLGEMTFDKSFGCIETDRPHF